MRVIVTTSRIVNFKGNLINFEWKNVFFLFFLKKIKLLKWSIPVIKLKVTLLIDCIEFWEEFVLCRFQPGAGC